MKLKNYFSTLAYAKHIFFKNCPTPIYIILFVTERCNARCKHCFGSFGGGKGNIKEEFTLDEYERLSNKMSDLLYLLPTGGEPFLRDDLPEIINIFYRNNHLRNVGIPTNGSLTKKTVASVMQILSLCPDLQLGVDISLDALNEAHDEIRGFPGLFDKSIETYWQLKELEKNHSNFKVCVEITVSSYNQDNLFEIYDYFLNELKVYNVFVRLVRGSPRDAAASNVDIDKYEQFTRKVEEDLINGVFHGHEVYPFSELITARDIIGRKIGIKMVRENKYQIPCYAGKLTGIIKCNGDVYPCELLDRKIGNLREHDYNLKELWQSETAQKIKKEIKDTRCFCTHECFTTNNLLFNPLMMPKIFKEYFKLKSR
jgi:radical SAM protein with 4Fe4S-binding SPASM domain